VNWLGPRNPGHREAEELIARVKERVDRERHAGSCFAQLRGDNRLDFLLAFSSLVSMINFCCYSCVGLYLVNDAFAAVT
jgi:hypothetical protein